MQGVSRTPARANHQPAEFERFRYGDHRCVGLASRPRGSIVPVWEKKDVVYLGLVVEDTGEKATVPRAPGVQRPPVDPEPVRHLPDSEATKADDPAVVVRIGKALEIRVTKQLVDVVGRNVERFGEAESQNGLTTCELTIDLEPKAVPRQSLSGAG